MRVLKRPQTDAAAGPLQALAARGLDETLAHPAAIDFRDAVLTGRWIDAAGEFTALSDWNDRNLLLSAGAGQPGRPEAVSAWADELPNHPLALLVRGTHTVRWAWQLREPDDSTGASEDMDDAARNEEFWRRLRLAEEDLTKVTRLVAGDPLSWSWLLRSGRGLLVCPEELGLRFDQSQRRCPALGHAYREYLQVLSSKWGGHDDTMLTFARSVSRMAPAGSALHDLVPIAHLECWVSNGQPDAGSYFLGAVADEIRVSASRSVLHTNFTTTAAYAPGLRALNTYALMLHLCGENSTAQKVLEAIGPMVTAFPWNYLDADPVAAHTSVCQALAGV